MILREKDRTVRCILLMLDKGDGRRCGVDQKDHLSCVRGSVDCEGVSDGDWLLLSSPFKLFLQTGHVSCISNQGTIQSE